MSASGVAVSVVVFRVQLVDESNKAALRVLAERYIVVFVVHLAYELRRALLEAKARSIPLLQSLDTGAIEPSTACADRERAPVAPARRNIPLLDGPAAARPAIAPVSSDARPLPPTTTDATCVEPAHDSVLPEDRADAAELCRAVSEALADGTSEPERSTDGENGAYLVRNTRRELVAVFKPLPEDLSRREVAAYQIDRRSSDALRAGVPLTIVCRLRHPAIQPPHTASDGVLGSLQRFVANDGSADDFGWQKYSTRSVQRVGLLDLRLLNADRHAGNLLLCGDRLVPIDHDAVLGGKLARGSGRGGGGGAERSVSHYWEWEHWRQAQEPLSADMRDALLNADIDADRALVTTLGLPPDSVPGTMPLMQQYVRDHPDCSLRSLAKFVRESTRTLTAQ